MAEPAETGPSILNQVAAVGVRQQMYAGNGGGTA
jgi:hypothetical protein